MEQANSVLSILFAISMLAWLVSLTINRRWKRKNIMLESTKEYMKKRKIKKWTTLSFLFSAIIGLIGMIALYLAR